MRKFLTLVKRVTNPLGLVRKEESRAVTVGIPKEVNPLAFHKSLDCHLPKE